MHRELLSDALKLLGGGSITAAADALRSALEIEFRPAVAEIVSRIEDRMRRGGGTEDIVADLREIVEEDQIFGAEIIVDDVPPRDPPGVSLDDVRRHLERSKSVSSESKVEAASGTSSGGFGRTASDPGASSGQRYRGAAPPPPPHRRRPLDDAPSPDPADDLLSIEDDPFDDFDLFGTISSVGKSHLDVEPEVESASSPGQSDPFGFSAPPSDSQASFRHRGTSSRRHVVLDDGSADLEGTTPAGGSSTVSPGPPGTSETGKMRVPSGVQSLPVPALIERARALMGRGDLASAQALVDEAIAVDDSHPDAIVLRSELDQRLSMLRMAGLQPLERVPVADMSRAGALDGNQRAFYLLTLADGSLSLQDLIDLSGMQTSEAATVLTLLIERGALRFD
jgi:hypothetical protein